MVLGYGGYYVAGWYLRICPLSGRRALAFYVCGAAGLAVTLGWGGGLYGYFAPNVAAMSAAVFVLFRRLGERFPRRCPRWISAAAGASFGIFLVHDFFLTLLDTLGLTALSGAPALTVPALTALVFLCAWAAAWALSKLPLVGRYIT